MEAPVYLYYQLTNFYQNHRRYAKSYFSEQLQGTVFESGASALDQCAPLKSNGTLVRVCGRGGGRVGRGGLRGAH